MNGDDPCVPADGSRPNVEWELADFMDAVAAEFDRAEDTMALKSYGRGAMLSVKGVALDVGVTVRRAADGRVFFRTAAVGEGGTATLRLDFTPLLQSQVEGGRRPLDAVAVPHALEQLAGITPCDVAALRTLGVFTLDDLERITPTPAAAAAAARRTGIAEAKLRRWLGLPYATSLEPAQGPPGASVAVHGGNLGAQPAPGAAVLVQGTPGTVESWSDTRVVVRMPRTADPHAVVTVLAGGGPTNALVWNAAPEPGRPRVEGVALATHSIHPSAGGIVRAEAAIHNDGDAGLAPFLVAWVVDGVPAQVLRHGALPPHSRSADAATVCELRLAFGPHVVWVIAAPEHPGPSAAMGEVTIQRAVFLEPILAATKL
jgi:peptide/nickel transport system substrate-binding protein